MPGRWAAERAVGTWGPGDLAYPPVPNPGSRLCAPGDAAGRERPAAILQREPQTSAARKTAAPRSPQVSHLLSVSLALSRWLRGTERQEGRRRRKGVGRGFSQAAILENLVLKTRQRAEGSPETRTRITAPAAPSLHAHRGPQPRGTVCTLPTIVDLKNNVLFLFKIKGGLRNGVYKAVTY